MQNLLSIDQIKFQYPDEWVLIGNPELTDFDTLEAIKNKIVRGTVLYASKDKREIGYKAKDLRKGFDSVVCIYTGQLPQNRKWLL